VRQIRLSGSAAILLRRSVATLHHFAADRCPDLRLIRAKRVTLLPAEDKAGGTASLEANIVVGRP
jgi:hypothetical protein